MTLSANHVPLTDELPLTPDQLDTIVDLLEAPDLDGLGFPPLSPDGNPSINKMTSDQAAVFLEEALHKAA